MAKTKTEFTEADLQELVDCEIRRRYRLSKEHVVTVTCVVDRSETPEGAILTAVGAVAEFVDTALFGVG